MFSDQNLGIVEVVLFLKPCKLRGKILVNETLKRVVNNPTMNNIKF